MTKKFLLSLIALFMVGSALADPVIIRHAKVSTKPASSDPSLIGGPDWNAPHVIDPTLLLHAQGINVISANPNGTSASVGTLGWDKTNAQLWVNTDGGTTWTSFLRSDGGQAPPRTLFEIWTDSNGVGPAVNTFEADPTFKTDVPNSNVVLTKIFTSNFAEPVTPVDMGTGPLRPANVNAFPGYGPELEIGRILNDVINGPGIVPDTLHEIHLDQFSIHSSKLSDWMQGSTAGSLSPLLGGGNLDSDSSNRAATAAATSGRAPAAAFVMLCSNDASDGAATSAIGTNIPTLIARKRSVLGNQLLFVWTLIQSTLPTGTFPNVASARANQIAALAAVPGTVSVSAEDMPTADDLAHFVAISETELSQRMGFAYVHLAGLRERIVSVPTVVGFSVATYNGTVHGETGFSGAPGSTLRVWPWQGSNDGDVMFVAAFRGDIGAGSAIPAPGASGGLPSSWTQAIQVSDLDTAGVGNHAALFWKDLSQSEKDTNVDATGGRGFPVTVTIAPGGAQFVIKPWSVRGPGRFPGVGTPVQFTHTTVDTGVVTAPGVSTTVGQSVYVMVFGWSSIGQSFVVANGSLSGLHQVFSGAYPSSSGNYLFVGLWEGTATGSVSGNSTILPVLASSSLGFTWAM